MQSLEAELDRARDLRVSDLADAIESIGFECTRCGACCKGYDPEETEETEETEDAPDGEREPHTATVFPDEVRELQSVTDYDWRDVARPMPYGLSENADGDLEGETFEWALQTDSCGDCTFYEENADGVGACSVHDDRPLICETYPFSVVLASEGGEGASAQGADGALGGTSQPMGEAVDEEGVVRAHECEGLGRDISRADAEDLAQALKARAVRELEEAIAVRDAYRPAEAEPGEVVVHDSEGAKRADGTPRSDGTARRRRE
ncbi:YkgJ family cysteine cluster protein [Halegenticoccus soli]|uniref:YkgJ family cysteine cluster protein n=1 Tax=Halegenticoccus soli TaxID=1985678 RepID=UPI000C6E848C|nr:YkgJ family cysteine cluster protein [Halegenticoccus soli]